MAARLSYNAGIIGLRRAADPPTPLAWGAGRFAPRCAAVPPAPPHILPRPPWRGPVARGPAPRSVRSSTPSPPLLREAGRLRSSVVRRSCARASPPGRRGAFRRRPPAAAEHFSWRGGGGKESHGPRRRQGSPAALRDLAFLLGRAKTKDAAPSPPQKNEGEGQKARPSLGPQNRTEG